MTTTRLRSLARQVEAGTLSPWREERWFVAGLTATPTPLWLLPGVQRQVAVEAMVRPAFDVVGCIRRGAERFAHDPWASRAWAEFCLDVFGVGLVPVPERRPGEAPSTGQAE